MQTGITADIKELQPDVIVECYLEAKYYHYDPEDIYELVDYNVNAKNLAESDDIATVLNIETDEYSAAASLNHNFHPPMHFAEECQSHWRPSCILLTRLDTSTAQCLSSPRLTRPEVITSR